MVRRLSVRKSYSTLEEKACRNDSRAARRVFALRHEEENNNKRCWSHFFLQLIMPLHAHFSFLTLLKWFKKKKRKLKKKNCFSPLISQVVYTQFEFVFRFFLGSLLIHLLTSCVRSNNTENWYDCIKRQLFEVLTGDSGHRYTDRLVANQLENNGPNPDWTHMQKEWIV